jgi:hypothetical protein
MADAQGQAHFIAFAKQTAAFRTAAESGFIYLPARAGGLSLERPSAASQQLRGGEQRYMRAQNQQATGSLPFETYVNSLGILLSHSFERTTAEVASYVVSAANNKIDFDIGGGALVATVANASYTSTSLAAAVKAALEAADATGTYTLTYSTATKKFTLARADGTFNLQWATGPNTAASIKSLIGFTADDTGAISYAADSQAPAIYDHAFSWPDDGNFKTNQQYGLTVLDHRDLYTLEGVGMLLSGLTLAYAENDPHSPIWTPTFIGADLDRIAAVSPTFGTDAPMTPDGNVTMDVVLNGNTHTAHFFRQLSAALTLPNGVRHTVGDTVPVKAIRTGMLTGQVSLNWDETNDTTYSADHDAVWRDADATADITLTQLWETIRGAIKQQIVVEMPALRPTGATPQAAAGTLDRPYAYSSQRDTENDAPGISITVRSTEHIA